MEDEWTPIASAAEGVEEGVSGGALSLPRLRSAVLVRD